MFKLFEENPDHPMFSLEEAKKLLADLPPNNAFKALVEVTDWLDSIKNASGFRPELRLEIIMLLDETGQPLQAELLHQYLEAPHLQDFQGLHLWQGIHSFMKALSEAYSLAIYHYQQEKKKNFEFKEKVPVVCVRLLRAVTEQMKLELMRYIEVAHPVWDRLLGCYSFAEASQCAESMVHAYSGNVIHTSPQRELLRALMLYESSPGTLAPDQIEVCSRITGRMASFFDFRLAPEEGCIYFVDLSMPGIPKMIPGDFQPVPSMRFFGAIRAISAIEKIISQNEHDVVEPERRFGNEFTPAGKLTVLRHLRIYWGNELPHRHAERRGIASAIEVAHGFRVVSQLVTRIDLDHVADLSETEATALKERAGINLVATENPEHDVDVWAVSDVSVNGIGAVLGKGISGWVKIGDLCGVRPQNSELWWVGMVRRLRTDAGGMVHAGIELLTKKPVSIWLRALGKGAEKASNWETSSGSFEYSYLPVILLPDAQNSYQHATMLMESGSYVHGNIYQAMMGEKSRDIVLTGLLAEGENYEHVSFQWLESAQT